MPLNLPATFSFSQSSLQAYESCPRRFWLAYVEQLVWPAVQAAPYDEHEQLLKQGAQFHQLIERAEAGLPTDLLATDLAYPLDAWFQAYLAHRPDDLPSEFVEAERVLSIPFGTEAGQYRLAARYDLIAAGGDGPARRAVVLDWKTNRRATRRATLQQRLQTVVYPFVLVEASENLPWGPLAPKQVEMRYWFTAEPTEPVVFRYSSDLHAANRTRLQRLLEDILQGESRADFPKVADSPQNRQRFCNYCVYRSHCDRGIGAGDLAELDDTEFFDIDMEDALEFSLEDIEEIVF